VPQREARHDTPVPPHSRVLLKCAIGCSRREQHVQYSGAESMRHPFSRVVEKTLKTFTGAQPRRACLDVAALEKAFSAS
jgi:hypothetical protein